MLHKKKRERNDFNAQNVQKNRGEIKGGTNEGLQRDEKECAPPKSHVTYSGDISSKVSHAQGTATIRRFIRLFWKKGWVKKELETLQTHSEFIE